MKNFPKLYIIAVVGLFLALSKVRRGEEVAVEVASPP